MGDNADMCFVHHCMMGMLLFNSLDTITIPFFKQELIKLQYLHIEAKM